MTPQQGYSTIKYDIDYNKIFDFIDFPVLLVDASKLKKALTLLPPSKLKMIENHTDDSLELVSRLITKIQLFDANQGAINFLHAESKQKLLKNIGMIITDESKKSIVTELIKIIENKYHSQGESQIRTFNHALIPVQYKWRVVSHDRQTFSQLIIAFIDISEKKEIQDKALELEKYKTFGRLAAAFAHEVRDPLNAILANTEVLYQQAEKQVQSTPFMENIRTQIERLSNLMNELLEFGKPDNTFIKQKENLIKLAKSTIEAMQEKAGQSFKLVDTDRTSTIFVKVDALRMNQVFINLFQNAIQHSPENSVIEVSLMTRNDKAILQIKDQGKGIDQEIMSEIFTPFFTTRSLGSGLGLSIVKRIVKIHQGDIAIWNNTPPPGCTVQIQLPLYQEE
jgi:signal transduction histidine kinase